MPLASDLLPIGVRLTRIGEPGSGVRKPATNRLPTRIRFTRTVLIVVRLADTSGVRVIDPGCSDNTPSTNTTSPGCSESVCSDEPTANAGADGCSRLRLTVGTISVIRRSTDCPCSYVPGAADSISSATALPLATDLPDGRAFDCVAGLPAITCIGCALPFCPTEDLSRVSNHKLTGSTSSTATGKTRRSQRYQNCCRS